MSIFPNVPGRGAALIVVLSILSIVVALTLAFFAMVRTERVSSGIFAESVEVRNLTDVPVNLVLSQIRKATENNAPRDGSTNFKTWASQPGMIRQYGVETDESNVRAKPIALYKLYSDDVMVVTNPNAGAATNGLTAQQVADALKKDTADLASWDTQPGMFTDLNEPVAVPGSATPSYKFPIVDPRAVALGTNSHAVDGFDYYLGPTTASPLAATVAGTVHATGRDDLTARMPMPVRWIYMLKDGSLVTPTSGDKSKTQFKASGANTVVPTATNPIVARVAFWTDDDCAKININTACEGTHWDMPVATSQTERDYATRVPAQNEFDRYPGHPATTCLSTVLQAFSNDYYVDNTMPADPTVHQRIHQLTPRYAWGGTKAGTQAADSTQVNGIPLKQDRLYASVEEMFFDPNRDPNNVNLGNDALELGKFFLTANSRAPEMDLFGKPRISLWPQSMDTKQRNPKDKLLAFLSETTGSTDRQWYWMREKNFASVTDPGSSQSSTQDYPGSSLNRNQSMFHEYFRYLAGEGNAGKPGFMIPGFGVRTFKDKYGAAQRDQLGAEIFDMLRWGVNDYSSMSVSGWPSYTYLPDRINNNKGQSSAVPLLFKESGSSAVEGRGFGRFPTVTQAVIVFARTQASATDKEKLTAYLLFETFVPTSGPPSVTPNVVYRVTKADNLAVTLGTSTQQKLGFGNQMDNVCYITEGTFGALACGNTPYTGLGSQLAADSGAKTPTNGNGGNIAVYPFVSQEIEIPKDSNGKDVKSTFDFSGGDLAIQTLVGWGYPNSAETVQTINMNFPGKVTLPMPRLNSSFSTLAKRFTKTGDTYETQLIVDGDVVRSVYPDVTAPPKGDLRIYSLMQTVPKEWFTVYKLGDAKDGYSSSTVERRQFLRTDRTASNGQFGPHDGALPAAENWGDESNRQSNHNCSGTLVQNFIYARGCPPAVPHGLNGALLNVGTANAASDNRPGDWDNGVGIIADGPYIRKPDEGNASLANAANPNDATQSTYMARHFFNKETGASYSPNRTICSAVQFGSLPTGIDINAALKNPTSFTATKPWQTLLFCPNPASRMTMASVEPDDKDHPGFRAPRDHLLLDFFWMPITEPYAISEPLSTAGKINMNYQIVPFTNIERSTGVRAVLKSARLTAITPDSAGGAGTAVDTSSSGSGRPYVKTGADVYKQSDASTIHKNELRYAIDPDLTMTGFRKRFNKSDIFRCASEVCEIFLVPKRLQNKSYGTAAAPPTSYDQMMNWWSGSLSDLSKVDAFELTGDNSREMPYNSIYPRLTTQSNTYTVHYRVQTLKKARSSDPASWVEGQDSVASEYRGSTTLERYLDPNDKEMGPANIGSSTFNISWDTFYRIRVIQRNQFVP